MNFTPSGRFGKLQTVKHLTIFLLAALAFVGGGRGATALPREATAALGPAANLPYPAGHILALQICLDRRGFSVNAMDGTTGRKTDVALATYCAVKGIPFPDRGLQAKAWEMLFPGEHIIDFMNLPYENTEKVAEKCIWQDVREVKLISKED